MSYKCKCGNISKKEHIKCPIGSCGLVGEYVQFDDVKIRKPIAKVSEKRKLENSLKVKGESDIDKWFSQRRLEMKGICENCGCKTNKDDDKYYRFNIAHILPKSKFKSVSTHPLNWIELCFFSNSCHTNVDNKNGWANTKCFTKVLKRFEQILPLIADDELKYIPKEFH